MTYNNSRGVFQPNNYLSNSVILWSNVKVGPALCRELDLIDMMILWFELSRWGKDISISMDYYLLWFIYYLTKYNWEVEELWYFKIQRIHSWKLKKCVDEKIILIFNATPLSSVEQLQFVSIKNVTYCFCKVYACLSIWLSFGYLLCQWFWLQLVSE